MPIYVPMVLATAHCTHNPVFWANSVKLTMNNGTVYSVLALYSKVMAEKNYHYCINIPLAIFYIDFSMIPENRLI